MSRAPKPRGDSFPVIFHHELLPAKRGEPAVSMPYLRGVTKKATVRIAPSLKAALTARGCAATAMIALADCGLRELLTTRKTLHSHFVPDGKDGYLTHMLTPTMPGMKAVQPGKLSGHVPHAVVSMPGPLSDAFKRHSPMQWVALMVVADWQLNALIKGKNRLISTPTEAILGAAKLT